MIGGTQRASTFDEAHERVEPDRVRTRGVYVFLLALVVVLALLHPLVGWVLRSYRGDRPVEALSREEIDLGRAEHWRNTAADLARTREQEVRHLSEYAWVDREQGIVRIPLERAMELIAARGAGPGPEAEVGRAAQPEDSNAE